MTFDWNWEFAFEILPRLLRATINTLIAAGVGYGIAMILGLVFALALRSSGRLPRTLLREVLEFIRSTPLVVQIFFIFYVGPQFGVMLSPWVSGMLAIGLHYSAYLSEVYRSGIQAIPRGQLDAAAALGMRPALAMRRIVLPQAIRIVIPPLGPAGWLRRSPACVRCRLAWPGSSESTRRHRQWQAPRR